MSTTTHNRGDAMNRLYRKRWFMPSFSLFLGALFLLAFWIGDQPGQGVGALGVMAVMAAVFYFGAAARRRSPASAVPLATSDGSGSTSTPRHWPARS
jgi:hypothetical protein